MPLVNFDLRASADADGGVSPDDLISGIDIVNLAGVNQFDRLIEVTAAMGATANVPPGTYEHVSTDASGNWTYAPSNRNT
jgi:hypothetical protein